jgi:hypothetical protein
MLFEVDLRNFLVTEEHVKQSLRDLLTLARKFHFLAVGRGYAVLPVRL